MTDTKVALWVRDPNNYVQLSEHFIFRIRPAKKFGNNDKGEFEYLGDLFETTWRKLLSWKPTALEIIEYPNPFMEFVNGIMSSNDEQVKDFFSQVSIITSTDCDIDIKDFLYVIRQLKVLKGFAVNDGVFNPADWSLITPELARLNVQALDISTSMTLLSALAVELITISGEPGLTAASLRDCLLEFKTVKTIVARFIDFETERECESLLSLMPQKFPNLKSLVWDWNMVDTVFFLNEREKYILKLIATTYNTLKLGMIAIIAFTPCEDSKQAAHEAVYLLHVAGISSVDLQPFCSKGVNIPNFMLILGGNDFDKRETLKKIIVEDKNPTPNLRQLLPLLSSGTNVPTSPPTLIDYGGNDFEKVSKTFLQDMWKNDMCNEQLDM